MLIQQAERAKARMMEVPGRNVFSQSKNHHKELIDKSTGDLIHSVLVDEAYSAVATHVDEAVRKVIMSGGYVDFTKLLPKDRISHEEDTRMEMVNRGGISYWVPIAERSAGAINSINKWEWAFRIFLKIYVEGNPSRAEELIQYNHIIHEAAGEYPWESVYAYDREFRIHISKFPTRNWGIILHQAWTLKMKRHGASAGGSSSNSGTSPGRGETVLAETRFVGFLT